MGVFRGIFKFATLIFTLGGIVLIASLPILLIIVFHDYTHKDDYVNACVDQAKKFERPKIEVSKRQIDKIARDAIKWSKNQKKLPPNQQYMDWRNNYVGSLGIDISNFDFNLNKLTKMKQTPLNKNCEWIWQYEIALATKEALCTTSDVTWKCFKAERMLKYVEVERPRLYHSTKNYELIDADW